MAQEETILLHFDIDEQPAVNSIKDLRTANSQLRAERDKVNIATKEGRELVDKLNVSIDKNNKVIKDNSSALEKQRQNVGNYSKSIQEAAGNLNIMGTNVGALGSKLASFANPATAAVAVVAALGAAYASSTIGARDLTFASNQLAAATGILTNEFASLFSSSEDGEGALTGLFNSLLNALGPAGIGLATVSKAAALAKEQIEDLNRNELIARAEINERLAENQELLTQIQDSQTIYNDKVHLTGQIVSNLRTNEEQILKIKQEQLAAIDRQLVGDQTNEKLLDARALKELEISSIQKDTERKVGAILRLESNLLDTENKRLEILKKQNKEKEKGLQLSGGGSGSSSDLAGPLKIQSGADEQIKLSDDFVDLMGDNERQITNIQKEQFQERLNAMSLYFNAASTIAATAFGQGSEIFKALSIGETIINTYSAATAALAPPPVGAGPVIGPALAAATIAAGLANVARISGVEFAEGGYTGSGAKYEPKGVVHGNEFVIPSETVSKYGGPQYFNKYLPQYADGGFVANSNQSEVRQAQMLSNALKNQPPIIASWTEGRAVGRKVEFKERVTRQ